MRRFLWQESGACAYLGGACFDNTAWFRVSHCRCSQQMADHSDGLALLTTASVHGSMTGWSAQMICQLSLLPLIRL